MATTLESSLIVPVPEASAIIEPWRARLDPLASYGMTSHVTVIYPFLAPTSWDEGLVAELTTLFGSMSAFDLVLREIAWFEPNVVWAVPTPDAPFRAMTTAVQERWPDLRPYGGTDPVVPHLTIGVSDDRVRLEEAAREVAASLPIAARAREVLLMTGRRERGTWRTVHRFGLADGG